MHEASEEFKAALRKSHTAVSKASLTRGGTTVFEDLPIISGSVTDDWAAQVRRRCGLVLPGSPEVMALLSESPPSDGGLWPLGGELHLESGIRFPSSIPASVAVYNNYLNLNGASASCMSTPNNNQTDISGDLHIELDVAATDWTPGTVGIMLDMTNPFDVTAGGYRVVLQTTGVITLTWSNGAAFIGRNSTVGIGLTDGTRRRIKVILDVNNGAAGHDVKFYTSTDNGGTWTQLGTTVTTAGTTVVDTGGAAMTIGGDIFFNNRWAGKVYEIQIRNGIDGTLVANPDFRTLPAGTTSFTDSTGILWTVGSAQATVVEDKTLVSVGSAVEAREELVHMGVFRVSKPIVQDSGADLQVSVEGFDRSRSVSRAGFTEPYHIEEGSNYAVSIAALIQSRIPWFPAEGFFFESSGYQTPDIIFTPSEDPWQVATQMAASIGHELFFDGEGNCILQPQPDPMFTPSSFDYVEGEEATLTSIGRDLDDQEAYNGVVVISENSDLEVPLRSVVWDTNPNSPTYYDPTNPGASIYGPVPKIVTTQLITTQLQCDEAAAAEFSRISGVIEKIDFQAINNPAHFAGDVIQVTRGRINVDAVYLLESITMGLGATTSMSGTTRKRSVT